MTPWKRNKISRERVRGRVAGVVRAVKEGSRQKRGDGRNVTSNGSRIVESLGTRCVMGRGTNFYTTVRGIVWESSFRCTENLSLECVFVW